MVGRTLGLALLALAALGVTAHSHAHKDPHQHAVEGQGEGGDHHPHFDPSHEFSHSHESEEVYPGEEPEHHFDLSQYINLNPIKHWCERVGTQTSAYVGIGIMQLSAFVIFAVLGILNKVATIKGGVMNSLIALAAGSLLGDVFLHIFPETSMTLESQTLVISGILAFYLFDKILTEPHDHSAKGGNKPKSQNVFLYLLADAMHNFLDGMAVAVAFRTKVIVGITTTAAILFHELPHELADFVVLMKSGRSLGKALWLQFLTGVSAMAGTWFALNDFSKETIDRYALPLIIGNFLYLAMTNMLGELKDIKTWKSLFAEVIGFSCGAFLMLKLTLIE